ncbi:MAG: VPLPA-CTERM sorting domain-containing protein [Alphaproteobacteria bacterium]|nr:VPLPA-CTERM sorting domain-containing protein [Alphaproteobacteria bacterium]
MSAMKKLVLPFCLLALFNIAGTATAATLYSYTGNNFDLIFDDSTNVGGTQPGTYNTSMNIEIAFELLAPLPANQSLTSINSLVQNFSFFDGRNTITDANAAGSNFAIATDSSGMISEWSINAWAGDSTFVGGTSSSIFTSNRPGVQIWDQGRISTCVALAPPPFNVCGGAFSFVSDRGFLQDNPGIWEISGDVSAVPLPAAFPLFLTVLAGMAGLRWWRRRTITA